MKKVLHFSSVSKKSNIVNLHLKSLKNLEINDIDVTFTFFDDNDDKISSKLLKEFINNKDNSKSWSICGIPKKEFYNERWPIEAYDRITIIKDYIINQFLLSDADYLFLTDSDLVIHPKTLKHLLDQDKDFISTIFWTHFKGRPTFFPNAWMNHPKTFSTYEEFIALKNKLIIPVDYTGACTLLSRKILENGVSFKRIPQVNALGEDKHFCIKAGVYGFQPFLSTHYPAFHIYNDELINSGFNWIESNYSYSYINDWLNVDWEKKIKMHFFPEQKISFRIKRFLKRFL